MPQIITAFFVISCIIVIVPVKADSVMTLPDGSQNIMVTFDELDIATTFPLTYRGVTYTLEEGETISMWVNPNMPITRYVKAPMLAMTTSDELEGEPTTRISLRLEFDQPTYFFGFSLGFNNRTQTPDASELPVIGSVLLEFSNGRTRVVPITASRVLCCTETRFDIADIEDGIFGNELVIRAIITLDYNYEPFAPASGYPGDYFILKFMGIDDVTYSTTQIASTMEVDIDVKPNKDPNVLNLASVNDIPVAVFTDAQLNAIDIDSATVEFGPGSAVASRSRVKDVDRDGDEDLLLYFNVQEAGFTCSDTQAILTGTLNDGTPIAGSDSIAIKQCQ